MTKEEAISAFKEWIERDEKMEYADRLENIEIYNMAIKALEQEPCEDAISREEVIDELNRLGRNAFKEDTDYDNFFSFLDGLPSVTPIRPKGGWIVREDNTSFVSQIPRRWVECSHCGWSFSYDRIKDDFCSKCGADMRGENG